MPDTILLDGKWNLFYEENSRMPKSSYLNTEEKLRAAGIKKISGTVPGNFEIDFERAGLIDDIFFGTNCIEAQKRENLHLWYTRSFNFVNDGGDYSIIFDGIDTFGEIYINGVFIAKTDNMFISHSFPANFSDGKNEITVHILPTMIEARKNVIEAGSALHLKYSAQGLTIRKAQHMFGWDIMPRIISGGIWKSVRIEKIISEKIDEIYLRTLSACNDYAVMALYYKLQIAGDFVRDYTLKITADCGDSHFEQTEIPFSTASSIRFSVNAPKLWWTRDLGEPNLYSVTAVLMKNGEAVDEKHFHLGIRTITLERTSLATDNGKFCFYINGEPLFVRGTNWVPLDALHSRDKNRIPAALELLYDSGCNAVRCWGGNVYEDDEFFDFCDSHGIMVWQDFGMGCALYPQTKQMFESLEKEITFIVKKLRGHASLAIWSGDNECDETGITSDFQYNPGKNRLTRELIPQLLSRHDPEREYLPSSPYIDEFTFNSRMWNEASEKHLWGPRDYFKSDYYTKFTAIFASEMGYHGCPSPESIVKFISPDKLWPWQDNDEWLAHATSPELSRHAPFAYRPALMAKQITNLFGEAPLSLERFAMTSQATQAEAMKFFVEKFRTEKPHRTGIIWWNLIDGWPQFSDAVIDYYYRKKLAYYCIKRSQQPLCIMMKEPKDGRISVVCANEFGVPAIIKYKITNITASETVYESSTEIKANSASEICSIEYNPDGISFYLMEWSSDAGDGKNYYICAKPPYDFDKYYEYMKKSGMWQADGFDSSAI